MLLYSDNIFEFLKGNSENSWSFCLALPKIFGLY